MDNITHTAVGALFTESIYQRLPQKIKDKPNLRRNLHIISALASNLPDFDLLMQLIDSSSLGYLVNHRGHTHTISGLILQLALLVGVSFLLSKSVKENLKIFLCVASFGLASHVGLDFLNSYGIHPFWPFNNSWYYGDTLFIIEPLIWITAAITFFHILKGKRLKSAFLIFTLSSPFIFTYVGYGSWFNTFSVYLFSTALFFHIQNKKYPHRAQTGLGVIFCIICAFALQSFSAKKSIYSSVSKIDPGANIIDVVSSPFPGNLICSSFLVITTKGDDYRVYAGTYSALESLLYTCPSIISSKGIKSEIDVDGLAKINFAGIFSQKIQVLKDISSMNCKAKAWLTYSRAPFFKDSVLYDLRYSVRMKENFASLSLNDDTIDCPKLHSPWTPPRSKWLE